MFTKIEIIGVGYSIGSPKIIFFPETEHVIFNSQNKILNGYYFEIFNFLDENL